MNNHSSKHTLSVEVVALRKQVNDLKDAAVVRRRVEDALRLSEEKCRALVEDAPVGLAHIPGSRQPLRVNAVFAALLGYADAAEFRTRGGLTSLFATDEARLRLVSSATDDVQHISINVRHRDGDLRTLDVLVRRSSDGDGVVLAAAGTAEGLGGGSRGGASVDGGAAGPASDPHEL
jgi:PAS domain-containing protein